VSNKVINNLKNYKKILNYFNNYKKLSNKKFAPNLIKLIFKVFFEVYLTKILQFFKFDDLLLKIIKKNDMVFSVKALSISNKLKIEKDWIKYNNLENNNYPINFKQIISEYNTKGYYYFGKIFSDEVCDQFIKSLNNKKFYNSQQPLQSDGKEFLFNLSNYRKKYNFNYFCFPGDIFLNFEPLKKFLLSNKRLFDQILNFDCKIYSAYTWVNLPSKIKHHTQYLHRDYEDFKFITIIINWNDVNENNGATKFIEGSHKSNQKNGLVKFFSGAKGSVYIVNNYGLHSGTLPREKERISTWLRLGHLVNAGTLQDGFVVTPKNLIF
jgi:hypothetical protein